MENVYPLLLSSNLYFLLKLLEKDHLASEEVRNLKTDSIRRQSQLEEELKKVGDLR